ncbi:uncharacterized protein V6R79_026439 [Siganus canaliculatus]
MKNPAQWFNHEPPLPVQSENPQHSCRTLTCFGLSYENVFSLLSVCAEVPRLALSVAEITVGALYLDECPREPYIPIYLMVLGIFDLTDLLFYARKPEDNSACKIFQIVFSLAHVSWFIAGNVWIYSIYQPNYNKDPASTDLYCNKNLYLFAFWITTLVYIFLGVVVLGAFCTLFCFCLCGRADPDDNV